MIYIFLPVYNEEENIFELLSSIEKFWNEQMKYESISIVIVNDGSSDQTHLKIKEFEEKYKLNSNSNFKISYIQHKINTGLGSAVKTGFEHIIADNNNAKNILVTMDGDNSHLITNIKTLISNIRNQYKVSICSRYVEGNIVKGVPFSRIIIANIGSLIFQLFFPIKGVKDFTCGYRAYDLQFLTEVFNSNNDMFSEKNFTCQADILIKLYKFDNSFKAKEIPINLRYDLKKGQSKMRLSQNILATLILIFKRKFDL